MVLPSTARKVPLDPLPRDPAQLASLVELLRNTGQASTADSLIARLARDASQEVDADYILKAAMLATQHHLNGHATQLLTRYSQLRPDDWQARLDLATLFSLTMRNDEAKRQLELAIKTGGDKAQQLIRSNPRLTSLHTPIP